MDVGACGHGLECAMDVFKGCVTVLLVARWEKLPKCAGLLSSRYRALG